VRYAVSLPGEGSQHRRLYLMPDGWSQSRCEKWGRDRDPRWASIWILPLLDAETDGPAAMEGRAAG
jgi:hypothetical protein